MWYEKSYITGNIYIRKDKTMESKMKLVAMSEGCSVNLPCLRFYHPNGRGTGCAMVMKLRPADVTNDGFIVVSFANQMTVGNPTGDNPTFPKFDWENKVDVVLDFNDLCAILQVLRGETESVCDGRGIFRKHNGCCQKIQMRHLVEPVCGYSFEVLEIPANSGDERRVHMLMSPAESLGIYEAITGSMHVIAFGSPHATA